MSLELLDIENPIIDLNVMTSAISALVNAMEGDKELRAVLMVLEKNLEGIHADLRTKWEAALAAEKGNVLPLDKVR